MKTIGSPALLLFSLIFTAGIIYFFSISGCKDILTNTTGENVFQARSELEFVNNSELNALPGAVIAVSLEDANSPLDSLPDTDRIGQDAIPFRYIENGVHKIRMEYTGEFSVRLVDRLTGAWIYVITPTNNSVTVFIPAGDYIMLLESFVNYNFDSIKGRQTIFIQPDPSISDTYEPKQLNTFISVGGCKNCDLSSVNLKYMTLSYLYFKGSNFSNANLSNTILTGSNLENTNFNSANCYGSVMQFTSLSNSTMKDVFLRAVNLQYANITGSDLTNGDIRFSDIRSANFCGSTLTGIITNGVVYDENTQCWP